MTLRAVASGGGGGGGSVTDVTASSPLASSGGATPNITANIPFVLASPSSAAAYFEANQNSPSVMRVGVEDGTTGGSVFTGSAIGAAVFGNTQNFPVQFFQNDTLKVSIGLTGAAGEGLTITAGTATTNVNALSITQTLNNAAVDFVGVKWTFIETAQNTFKAFSISGGAAGTTELFRVQGEPASFTARGEVMTGTASGSVGFGWISDPATGFGRIAAGELAYYSVGSPKVLFGASSYPEKVLQLGATWMFSWEPTADGVGAAAADTALTRVSAAVVGVSNAAGGVGGGSNGTIQAKHNSSDGSAGINFGPGTPSSITVKDGIIVAAT